MIFSDSQAPNSPGKRNEAAAAIFVVEGGLCYSPSSEKAPKKKTLEQFAQNGHSKNHQAHRILSKDSQSKFKLRVYSQLAHAQCQIATAHGWTFKNKIVSTSEPVQVEQNIASIFAIIHQHRAPADKIIMGPFFSFWLTSAKPNDFLNEHTFRTQINCSFNVQQRQSKA